MSQTAALIDALKRSLKAHGRTYADVATALGVSTASVKRLFATQSLSLARLDDICALLDIELADLVAQMNDTHHRLQQLSEAQEQAIADDLPLLLVTVAVLNQLGIEDILARFRIDRHACVRKLAWLDRQGLIELLPKDRIKLRVAPNFAWRPHGPIQRFFQARISPEYFSGRFDRDDERLLVMNGLLSAGARDQFQRRLARLAQEFEEIKRDDMAHPLAERAGYTVVLAQRPWVFGVFSDYLKE